MKNKINATMLAAVLIATFPAPSRAWVAAGGYRGGAVRVGYHPPCCYGGAVAGAAVAGAMVGAAATSAAYAAAAPAYYAPDPTYYGGGATYGPAVGTVVSTLPPTGCSSMSVNGIEYMNCSGITYRPFYSGGALMYQVAQL